MTIQEKLKIPTYDASTLTWGHTVFNERVDFVTFLDSLWKQPGLYEFDEDFHACRGQAVKFNATKVYCLAPEGTKDFYSYWGDQKEKCRKGVIIKGRSGKTWYIPRDYYMWLNFLPIYNKAVDAYTFPEVRDAQYHLALYECRGEWHFKHGILLKKRQMASSYYHSAKQINILWFEAGATIKLLAYLDDYINMNGTWKFIEEYKDFLNEHTAWVRPMNPSTVGKWQQRVPITINGTESYMGLKSRLLNVTTQQNATKGVGGACRLAVIEESGVNPTMDKTYEYMRSALQDGFITTGYIVAHGSVGDLKQCEPLKKYLYRPEENGFLGVETDLFDDKGTIRVCGLFIPENWSMPPYMDKYGNSYVEEAKQAVLMRREEWKRSLEPEDYQLRISQGPLTIEEAFASREESPFPTHILQGQMRRIQDGEYPMEFVDLFYNEQGFVDFKPSNKRPIAEFPLSKTALDKEGVVVMYERPDRDLTPLVSYYASVDPIHVGKTTTSVSLCTIIVYKNPVRITREVDGEAKTFVEGDKIVCEWTGRMDDLDKVHDRLLMIIELYKAWTLVELNGSFITHMTNKKKTHYLVPSDQMIFNRELQHSAANSPYGWKNNGTLFVRHILPVAIAFCLEELDSERLPDGEKIITKYGVQRIPSLMLLKEMMAYHSKLNVDRLVAYAALVAFVNIQIANRGLSSRIEKVGKEKKPTRDIYKMQVQPFNSMNKGMANPMRSPFKQRR